MKDIELDSRLTQSKIAFFVVCTITFVLIFLMDTEYPYAFDDIGYARDFKGGNFFDALSYSFNKTGNEVGGG